MKKAIFIKTLVLSAIVFLSCAAKAQSDTAWMDTNYIDQYIFPPLVDDRWEDEYRYEWYGYAVNGGSFIICEVEPEKKPADYVAQKYEAEDSVTLAGIAVLLEGSPFDSLTVEIWDDALSSVLLSKTFICAESQEHLFYECMFNEPITLYNDYYVSVRLYRCNCTGPGDRDTYFISVLKFREFPYYAADVPQGCNIKYEPYFKLCDEDEWKLLDEINTWGLVTESLIGYNYDWITGGTIDGRPLVIAPFGICPIRASESSSALGNTPEMSEGNISIYPLPAKDRLNIKASDCNILHIEVFDAMNRKVLETNANNDILNIDLSDFKFLHHNDRQGNMLRKGHCRIRQGRFPAFVLPKPNYCNNFASRFLIRIFIQKQLIAMIRKLDEIIEAVKAKGKKRLVAAYANDSHTIGAASMAMDLGIVEVTLVGDEQTIKEVCAKEGIDVNKFRIVQEANEQAAANKAVELINAGEGDILMKGLCSTDKYMRAILNKEKGLMPAGKPVLSHVTVFEVPAYHKLLITSDVAVIPAPDFKQKVAITNYVINTAKTLGIDNPKVAMIAPTEQMSVGIPSCVDAALIAAMANRGQIKALVDGPLALDVAIDKESATIKKLKGEVAGDADCLVWPNIEAGNVFYKSCTKFAKAELAAMVVGAKVPCVLSSRGDSTKTKMYSIALAALSCK